MHIEYTGRHTEVSDDIRGLAEKKLSKLRKVLPGITDVHVVLASDKHRQIAEVSVQAPHLALSASDEGSDFSIALTNVMDKLTRQAQRRVGKLRTRTRRGPARLTALWAGVLASMPGEVDASVPVQRITSRGGLGRAATGQALAATGAPVGLAEVDTIEAGPRVVRTRRMIARTMTVEDAARQVDQADEGFVVYRDSLTDNLNVLYRRKDGQLGLIEPEA